MSAGRLERFVAAQIGAVVGISGSPVDRKTPVDYDMLLEFAHEVDAAIAEATGSRTTGKLDWQEQKGTEP